MRRVILTLFVLGLSVASAFAQGAGQINGALTDSSGGVIPGATVAAIESATGPQNRHGDRRERALRISLASTDYLRDSRRADGLQDVCGAQTSSCRRTRTSRSTSRSSWAILSETITVAGDTATVDITTATIAEVVDHARIVELPIAGPRSGEAADAGRGHGASAQSARRPASRCRARSAFPPTAQASARTPTGWTARATPTRTIQENQSFPFPDALQEFSIQTSNYSAAHGNNAGAVVNVVTRSGTNSFHGGAFEYLRDRKFNSKNFFAAEKDFLKRNQYGGVRRRPDQAEQHVLLRRVAAHAHHEPRVGAHQLRADRRPAQRRLLELRAGVSAALQPSNGPAVPEQPDSRAMFDPAAVKVFAALPTSTAPNGQCQRSARHRSGFQPVRAQSRSAARQRTTSSAFATSSTTSTTNRSSFRETFSAIPARAWNRIRAVRAS